MSKTAIVTGASSGIGLAIAKALLERGYNLVATSRNASRTSELQGRPNVAIVDGDVGHAATAERAVAAAKSRFGGVQLLVNNAGSFLAKPFVDYTADDYAQLLSTNLAGFFHMTQHALSPSKRMGTTQDMADAVLYLEGASFVSGEILHVDGGAHAGK